MIYYILGYLLCCILAFLIGNSYEKYLNQEYKLDYTLSDLIFVILISLFGPLSLIVSVIIWLTDGPPKKIVLKKNK